MSCAGGVGVGCETVAQRLAAVEAAVHELLLAAEKRTRRRPRLLDVATVNKIDNLFVRPPESLLDGVIDHLQVLREQTPGGPTLAQLMQREAIVMYNWRGYRGKRAAKKSRLFELIKEHWYDEDGEAMRMAVSPQLLRAQGALQRSTLRARNREGRRILEQLSDSSGGSDGGE